MECRFPDDKLADLKLWVGRCCRCRKLQLPQMQSLLGKLNFGCRIMPMGRVFCRRLALSTMGVSVLHHFVRLSAEVHHDLVVWDTFLATYNGCSVWLEPAVNSSDCEVYTDALGGHGFGAYFHGQWCATPWPKSWRAAGLLSNLALLELFPIVVATIPAIPPSTGHLYILIRSNI